MAQTFVGNLILKLQENVSAGAKKAAGALRGLENAAKGLGKSGSGADRLKTSVDSLSSAMQRAGSAPWGSKLQQQFERLGATSKDLDRLRTSWVSLQQQMQGLGGKLRTNEIAAWRVHALSNLAAVKAKMKETETAAHQMQRAISGGLRPIGYAAGIGGGVYGGSRVIGGAAKASASYEDLKLALDQKNWGADVKGKIIAEADRLAARWGQTRATALETLMDAAISSDKPLDALKKSETYGRSLVLENLYSGPDQAADGVRNLDKARDSLGIEKPEDVKRFFDNYYKAKSILGKDLSTDQYRQAVQMARTAGKAADMEYLATTLPSIIAESKGGDAGTKMRAAFDQFVVGRASKKAKDLQTEFGLRDAEGALVGEDKFSNPTSWINDVLIPALEKQGALKRDADGRVGGDAKVKLARVLGELTNNRLSSDFLYQLIDQGNQYERQKRQMRESKGGLEGADQVLAESPTMAWRALQGSLQNLASTAGETVMPVILPALQGLSSGLNSIATALQGMDATKLTAMGGAIGALGAAGGLFGAYKLSTSLMSLTTAGPSLQTAATMLQAAAARLGSGAPGLPSSSSPIPGEAAKKGGAGAWVMGALARLPGAAAGLGAILSPFAFRSSQDEALKDVPGATREEKIANQHRHRIQQNAAARREAYFEAMKGIGPQRDSNIPTYEEPEKRRSIYDGFARGKWTRKSGAGSQSGEPAKPTVDTSDMDAAKAKAATTGQEIQSGLNVTSKPVVDVSMIDQLIAKGREAIGVMQQLNASIGSASAAGSSIGSRVRAARADFGVAP